MNAGKSGDYAIHQEVVTWKGQIMIPREKSYFGQL